MRTVAVDQCVISVPLWFARLVSPISIKYVDVSTGCEVWQEYEGVVVVGEGHLNLTRDIG